jgi:hypothetical protein
MNDALATATYWAPLLETIADIAFAVVIVALAVELISGRIAKRFERIIDNARELKIAELQRIAPRILSISAQNDVREKLAPFGRVVAYIGTTTPLTHAFDIDSLGSQIAGVLSLAGWRVTPGVTWGSEDRPAGIVVSTREGNEQVDDAARIFVSELNKDFIQASYDPKHFGPPKSPGMPPLMPEQPDIQIVIGPKP